MYKKIMLLFVLLISSAWAMKESDSSMDERRACEAIFLASRIARKAHEKGFIAYQDGKKIRYKIADSTKKMGDTLSLLSSMVFADVKKKLFLEASLVLRQSDSSFKIGILVDEGALSVEKPDFLFGVALIKNILRQDNCLMLFEALFLLKKHAFQLCNPKIVETPLDTGKEIHQVFKMFQEFYEKKSFEKNALNDIGISLIDYSKRSFEK